MASVAKYVKVVGLSFLEFSGPRPELLTDLFKQMGFIQSGSYRGACPEGSIELYCQGNIRFISNASTGGSAEAFRGVHKRGASAMGFKVVNSREAFETAIALGAKPVENGDFDIPAISGVGASIIYLVDEEHEQKLFSSFGYRLADTVDINTCLQRIDHLTHNLNKMRVEPMCQFYEKIFGFKRIRSFHIEGKKTGLYSEVVASPCGQVVIPLNETKDDKSQIAEFLNEYNGEGIQHIALSSSNIYKTVGTLRDRGIAFQDTPECYFDKVNSRLPDHKENVEKLRKNRILIDGGESQGGGFLLQIFTKNSIGPIFFEYIQRKGNDGFGEGNFQALFESIELDQLKRGVI